MKMRKLRIREKRKKNKTPIGKQGVDFNINGDARKTIKISKDKLLPPEYLGNDANSDSENDT